MPHVRPKSEIKVSKFQSNVKDTCILIGLFIGFFFVLLFDHMQVGIINVYWFKCVCYYKTSIYQFVKPNK